MENTQELIVVEQLPVIIEQLHSIRDEVKQQVLTAQMLACTEDTVKDVKAARANLNRTYRELEERRRTVKTQIMAPYLDFEKVYKECVTDIFAPADKELADKVAGVEDGLRAEKLAKLDVYFRELRAVAPGLDWMEFDRLGVNVTLSASLKGLKEQVKKLMDRYAADVESIRTMPDALDIMVEYKQSLNLPGSIKAIHDRNMKRSAEAERIRKQAEDARKRAEAAAQVQSALEQERLVQGEFEAPDEEPLAPPEEESQEPAQEPAPQEPEEPAAAPVEQKVYRTSFTVFGTIPQLQALKEFLNKGGYHYE